MAPAIFLVTGTTSGIGAALVNEIAARGDKVIAAGRKVEERLIHLKSENVALLDLDVSAGLVEIQSQIKKAWNIFGHIDVLMNNAGISSTKSAEEADEAFIENMFQVNVFGQMRITQAILPFLRAQGHGIIGFTSSGTAWAALPFLSHYAASKAALSTYVESLHKEVRPLGIQCVALECGGFPTHLGQPREESAAGFGSGGPAIAAYEPLFNDFIGEMMSNPMAHMPGDLNKAAIRIVDILKKEGMAAGRPWAVRVALGSDGVGYAKQRCEEQLKLSSDWKDLSCSTDRDNVESTVVKDMFKFLTVLES